MESRPAAVTAAVAALMCWLLAIEQFRWWLFLLGLGLLIASLFLDVRDPRVVLPSTWFTYTALGLVGLVVLGGIVSFAGLGFGAGRGVSMAGGTLVSAVVLAAALAVVVGILTMMWLLVDSRDTNWQRLAFLGGLALLFIAGGVALATVPEEPESTPRWARLYLSVIAIITVALALLPHITWFDDPQNSTLQR